MLPFIIGGVALAATGYGLKKYLENDNKSIEDITPDFFDWGDNLGDSIVYGDKKEDKTLKDVIEEFKTIHKGFYEEVIPYFLDVYGNLENFPELDIDNYNKLESKTKTNISHINDQEKAELDEYVMKLSKGICAVWMELKEIRLLQNENYDFNYFQRKKVLSNQKILEQNDSYMTISTNISYDDEILKVVKYWIPYINIIEPVYLKEKLNSILKKYINNKPYGFNINNI